MEIGHRFSSNLLLTEEEIIEGAKFVADGNPIHGRANHQNSRVSGIIASGSHVTGLFSALIPTHTVQYGHMLGLEMSFEFRAPILPDTLYLMEWAVTDMQNSAAMGGNIFSLQGEIKKSGEKPAVHGTARILLYGS